MKLSKLPRMIEELVVQSAFTVGVLLLLNGGWRIWDKKVNQSLSLRETWEAEHPEVYK